MRGRPRGLSIGLPRGRPRREPFVAQVTKESRRSSVRLRSKTPQKELRPRKRLRTKTPERKVLFVRQRPNHRRTPGGGHPQKRLRTKTPPRDVEWARTPSCGTRPGHKTRRPQRAEVCLAPPVQPKRRGRPPKRAPRGLDGFESPVEVFSPTVCEEDLLAKDTMKHWGTAPRPSSSEEKELGELDEEEIAEPGTEGFFRRVSPKSEAASADVDGGLVEMLLQDEASPSADTPAEATAATIEMIKKMVDFKGTRCPSGQRNYARRDVYGMWHELFLQAQKLVGNKIWRGQALHYIVELMQELEGESSVKKMRTLYQNASFWKGALLLLLKHLGCPVSEVNELKRKYYLRQGRISQRTLRRPDFKDLSDYYAKCRARDPAGFEVDPATPQPPRFVHRPHSDERPEKAEKCSGAERPRAHPMLFYIVRQDNSAYCFRQPGFMTVRQCIQEAFAESPYDPECFFCLHENEALHLDTEIGDISWQTKDREPRLLYVYLRNRARQLDPGDQSEAGEACQP
ncbi:unnamed protein product [Symbiodinium natans]|uniref:Uncharacterized protein n=1 Tax=Symbiodinium natans TaxID=878477 RepID=A0A812PQ48_9DINO|nr:unnamed protein product [Symbiodinium natans]